MEEELFNKIVKYFNVQLIGAGFKFAQTSTTSDGKPYYFSIKKRDMHILTIAITSGETWIEKGVNVVAVSSMEEAETLVNSLLA